MNRFSSIFSQMLQLFSRLEFQRAVVRHRAERHARGFTCWGQFVAMLFCQLGQSQSLREICVGLAGSEGKLKHLGVPAAPKRSTLAYANEHRPWELYQTVFQSLFQRCQEVVGAQKKFRFRNPLLSIDSTLIDLCSSVFDWAVYSRDKGAAKLHMVLDHRGYLPKFAFITEGKVPELIPARMLEFEPGTIVVFDKGYVDYKWYERLTRQGVYFVTRPRRDARYKVVETREPPRGIVRDEIVRLGDPHHRQKSFLRLIEVRVPDREESLILLTNLLHFGATTVAQIYKERWQIEVFFRALKQNLRIKTFVGTSANALKIQIWTALIAMLVLKYLQLKASIGWSLSNLVALLRHQLFVYRDLMTWLNRPAEPPPILSSPMQQLSLAFAESH